MAMYRVYGQVYEAATPEEAFAKAEGAQAPDSLAPPRAQGFAPPVPPKQKYRIHGEIFEAEDPEGAFAQYAQQQKIKEVESQPFYQKMWHGASNPIEEAYYGGKQLLQGGLDQEDTAYVQQLRDELEGAGGWGTAGEAATWLVPGAVAGKLGTKALQLGGRALGKTLAGRAAGQALGGAGLEGAYQASRARLEGDASRGERAALGAGVGALGGAVGELIPSALSATMRKLGKPMRTSDAAKTLQREAKDVGVDLNLTLGQSADPTTISGSIAQGMESLLDKSPLASKLLADRSNAMGQWNLSEIRQTLPADLQGKVTATGNEGFEQLHDTVNKAYDAALSPLKDTPIPATDKTMGEVVGLADKYRRPLTAASAEDFESNVFNLYDDLADGKIDAVTIKPREAELRELREKAVQDRDFKLADGYKELLEVLRGARNDAIGPEAAGRLAEIDRAYSKMMPMVVAAGYKGGQDRFTPSLLKTAALRNKSPWAKSTGGSVDGRRLNGASDVFGTTLPPVGPGTSERLLASALLGGLGAAGTFAFTDADMDTTATAGLLGALAPAGFRTAGRIGLGKTLPQRALSKAAGAAGRGTAKGIPLARATYIANQRNRERKQ